MSRDKTERKLLAELTIIPNESTMAGAGFEPAKAVPPDLQSGPVGRFGTLP